MENVSNQLPSEREPLVEHIQQELYKQPHLYKVVLHNDDFTTMDFVIEILKQVFDKDEDQAIRIMLAVHEEGIGVCGIYPKEIAEFRMHKTIFLARQAGFPLHCNIEKE